jgi:hypothetical protein
MQPYEISRFKGVNKLIDSSKLEPGEMVQLKGASISDGSIKNLPMANTGAMYELAETFPVPTIVLDKTAYSLGDWNPGTASNSTVVEQLTCTDVAFKISVNVAAKEPMTFMLLAKCNTNNAEMLVSLYLDNSGSIGEAIPSTTLSHPQIPSGSLGTADTIRMWKAFTLVPNLAVNSDCWVSISIPTSVTFYGHPSQNQSVLAATGSWASWASAFPGKAAPQFMYITSHQSTGSEVLSMGSTELPYEPWQGNVIAADNSFTVADLARGGAAFSGCALAVYENANNGDVNYRRSIITFTDGVGGRCISKIGYSGGTSQYSVSIIPKVNFIITAAGSRGCVLSATVPECQYCFPITLMDRYIGNNSINPSISSSLTGEYGVCIFQDCVALTGGGTDGYVSPGATPNNKPNYISLRGFAGGTSPEDIGAGFSAVNIRGYSASGVPDKPSLVVNFGEHVIYLKNSKYPFRMWYGNPGEIDSFNALENVSQAESILGTRILGNELLIFFANKIRRFSGVPRYGSITTIKETGIENSRFVTKANGGLFILSTDGLWFYNGGFSLIPDKSKIFTQVIGSGNVPLSSSSDYAMYQSRLIHVPNMHCIGIVRQDFDRYAQYAHTSIWFYDYWTEQWFEYYNQTLTQVGTFPMSIFRTDSVWVRDPLQSANGPDGGFMMENVNNFSPFSFETGWIDPQPGLDKKRFLHFVLEGTRMSSGFAPEITILLTFDDGSTISWTTTFGSTPSGDYVAKEKMLGITARKFKVGMSCVGGGSVGPYTNPQVQIHRFIMFYESGKQK